MLALLLLTLLQDSQSDAAQIRPEANPAPTGFVEILEGDLPLVLSAPHGGSERPESAPDRREGVLKRDTATRELALELADAIEERFGKRPFVVASKLHRIKLDPNRPLAEAAQGSELAERVWSEYHGALERACAAARKIGGGKALLLDIHGHAHEEDWIELGFALSARQLALPDQELAEVVWFGQVKVDVAWLRGPQSFGARLEEAGLAAVPSPRLPHPDGKPYFSGGYIVRRHRGAGLRAVQAELPFSVRREAGREKAVLALAQAIAAVLDDWFPRRAEAGSKAEAGLELERKESS